MSAVGYPLPVSPRTIAVPLFLLGMRQPPALIYRWPEGKAPNAVLPFTLDISADLDALNDTVSTFTAVVRQRVPGDLIVASQSSSAGILTAVLAQGVAGTDYDVDFRVTTAGGYVLTYSVALLCTGQPSTINATPTGGTMAGPYYTIALDPSFAAAQGRLQSWPPKDPTDTIPRNLDCTAYLAANGFTLTGVTVLADAALTVVASGLLMSGNAATGVWIQTTGGVDTSSPRILLELSFIDIASGATAKLAAEFIQPIATAAAAGLVPANGGLPNYQQIYSQLAAII